MEVQFTFGDPKTQIRTIALDRMVTRLLPRFQPAAVRQKSFIINDVPPDFYVDTDKEILAAAISSLFVSFISRTHNSCIRVTAKRYNNIVLLRLKDANTGFTSVSDYNWQEARSLAAKLGGCVIIDDMYQKSATITLSFRCEANAA
ncbi:MAG: hypothetical protein ACHQEB_06195 [Chitinophagales bacterium]